MDGLTDDGLKNGAPAGRSVFLFTRFGYLRFVISPTVRLLRQTHNHNEFFLRFSDGDNPQSFVKMRGGENSRVFCVCEIIRHRRAFRPICYPDRRPTAFCPSCPRRFGSVPRRLRSCLRFQILCRI